MRRTLEGLRNTRDLRAAILDGALEAASAKGLVWLDVVAPVIRPATVTAEWERVLTALAPELRQRLRLNVRAAPEAPAATTVRLRAHTPYEIVRRLIEATLMTDESPDVPTQGELATALGVSLTPVRAAMRRLRDAEVISSLRTPRVQPERLSAEMLSRIGALPQTLSFRFERGAQIKSPAALLDRARPLLGRSGAARLADMALSGTPVALADVPSLDLVGTPRVDLMLYLEPGTSHFDVERLRSLDDGLELERNVLAPAPVVVTVTRSTPNSGRRVGGVRCAARADVFLSLLAGGWRDLAIDYARTLKRAPP